MKRLWTFIMVACQDETRDAKRGQYLQRSTVVLAQWDFSTGAVILQYWRSGNAILLRRYSISSTNSQIRVFDENLHLWVIFDFRVYFSAEPCVQIFRTFDACSVVAEYIYTEILKMPFGYGYVVDNLFSGLPLYAA